MKHFAKKILTNLIHYTLSFPGLNRYYDRLLCTWHTPNKRTQIDCIIYPFAVFAWLNKVYYQEKNPNIRIALQDKLMGAENGVNWAILYDSSPFPPPPEDNIGNLSFHEASPIFNKLEAELSTSSSKSVLVLQIGSSSGREINYFAQKFSQISFIGIDLFDEVVQRSKKVYSLSNLDFVTLPAHYLNVFFHKLSGFDEIFIFSSGSSQYIQPEHLKIMFQEIKNSSKKTSLYLLEPTNYRKADPLTLGNSIPRDNLSFIHNYSMMAKDAQLNILECEIIKPYEPQSDFYPNHQGTAHYYLHICNSDISKIKTRF